MPSHGKGGEAAPRSADERAMRAQYAATPRGWPGKPPRADCEPRNARAAGAFLRRFRPAAHRCLLQFAPVGPVAQRLVQGTHQ